MDKARKGTLSARKQPGRGTLTSEGAWQGSVGNSRQPKGGPGCGQPWAQLSSALQK